jgi:hypothetical protein
MQEQRAPVKQPDVLSWQYVVLMVAIALLVVLVANVPVDIQRASPPTSAPQVASGQSAAEATPVAPSAALATAVPVEVAPLTSTDFTQHYEDESGIAFDYPTGWYTGMPQPGYVLLTNFPQDVESLPDNWAIIGVQTGTLADMASADGTAPEPGTSAHDLIQTLLDNNGLTSLEIQDITIDGKPAARIQVPSQGQEFAFVLITPNENGLVTVRGEIGADAWDEFGPLFDSFLETMTLNIPAS